MNTDWQEDALCAQVDPDLFMPEVGGSAKDAKRTCNACDVRAQCLAYAVEAGERWGVWGGLGQQELRRLIRARRAETEAA
ncbi:WhiB family transcriptional regulator [Streptomyces sp. NBC_00338]|uniref:WhiB family transcriptional regulator n=1 Tax=Streptomyces sp. NBC_00338 TaxID=2975715 RepID=UPI002253C887|nr:WhiB family transcriptional regulator [Streptomyces sp. NBC_00338]MCX5138359.1 WhiB family transcriptional regulator [Streptomyces sp. NBC_00338]MCX5145148.1 WhiB family transcriptional regulator [Streptomyces sp. NBC_00338]